MLALSSADVRDDLGLRSGVIHGQPLHVDVPGHARRHQTANRRRGPNIIDTMTFVPSSRSILYSLAEPHAGWFRAADAVAAGVSRQQLSRFAASGVVERSSHGVYRLREFPAQPFEDVIEVCLWAGSEASASHDTALVVFGVGDAMPSTTHITVPRRLRKRRPGVTVHITPVEAHDKTVREGVPLTSIGRTLRDVAPTVPAAVAAALVDDAQQKGVLRTRAATSLRKLIREE